MKNPNEYRNYDESGTVVVRVPKGTHYLRVAGCRPSSTRSGGCRPISRSPRSSWTARRSTRSTRATASNQGFTLDRPEARPFSTLFSYDVHTEWGADVGDFLIAPDFQGFSSRPSRTRAPGYFKLTMGAILAKPDGTGTGPGFHASPYLYHVLHTDDSGGVPADLTPELADEQLAKVVSSHAVATPGMIGVREGGLTMPLPYTLTEYYTPGTEWAPSFSETPSWDARRELSSAVGDTPRVYELGETVRERWNVGVFGPGFPELPTPANASRRLGDEFRFCAGLHGDQNPDTTWHTPTRLAHPAPPRRCGRRRGAAPGRRRTPSCHPRRPPTPSAPPRRSQARCPPGSTRSGRSAPHTSGGDQPTVVPALTVRFAPNLDDHNAAPAGKKFRFPVYVQRNGAEQPGAVNTPTVDISYDDGATWQKVRLTRHTASGRRRSTTRGTRSPRPCAGRSPTQRATRPRRPSSTPTR